MLRKIQTALLKIGNCAWGAHQATDSINSLDRALAAMQMFQLEDRVLYSASPFDPSQASEVDTNANDGLQGFDNSNFEWQTPADSSMPNLEQSVYLNAHVDSASLELIIVDTSVEGHEQLVNGIESNSDQIFELVYLDPATDSIETISELLADYSELDAVHFISHGNRGQIQLGESVLTVDSFDEYAGEIAQWGSALAQDADLLFYGCDLASTATGEFLVEAISDLTGADVAASNDLTGHETLGGDWLLEFATGTIESEIPFGAMAQQSWFGLLAVTANDDAYATGENSTLNEPALGVLANDTGGGAVAPVTLGSTLNYEASLDTNVNGIWEDSTLVAGYDWVLDGSVAHDNSLVGAPDGITAAFVFDGTAGGTVTEWMRDLTGDPTDGSATFEIWFRPDTPADNRGVLFDTGNATDGLNLRLYQSGVDSFIEFVVVKGSTNFAVVTANITSEMNSGDFIQIAATIDVTTGTAELFVNGTSVGSDTNVTVDDWSKNDTMGIGQADGFLKSINDPHSNPFTGEIGIFRFYESVLLPGEVQNNYDAIMANSLTVTAFDATSASGATVNVSGNGSFSYDPGTLFDYLKDGESVIDTFSYNSENGIGESDTATVSITVNGLNEAPTAIAPTSFNIDENVDTTSGTSLGTLVTTDEDAGETFTYSIQSGADQLKFSIGGIGSDELILTDGVLDFESQPSYSVTVRVADGDGNTYDEALTVSVNDLNEELVGLWISTKGDVASSGTNGLTDWNNGEVVQFGSPNFALEPGTSSGAFTSIVDLDAFGDGNVTIRGIHYVTKDIVVGGLNNVSLFAGDLLLNVQGAGETLNGTGINELVVDHNDIFVFRADVAGDYSAGTFLMLLDDFAPDHLHAFTLVEHDTLVGDTTIGSGDFLFVDHINSNVIKWFDPTGAGGGGDTTGTVQTLIDGADLGFTALIEGLDLIERDLTLNGQNLQSGQIIITLATNATVSGVAMTEFDAIRLDVTATTLGSGTAAATAALLLEGADISLDTFEEAIHAFSLVASEFNSAPIPNDQLFVIDEGLSNGSTVGTVVATDVDSGADGLLRYRLLNGTGSTAFSIDNAGLITVADATQLDFETTSSFTIIVQVNDGGTPSLLDLGTITINLNDINEAPTAVTPTSFNIDENIDTSSGTSVGTLVTTDEDAGETFTYTIQGGADQLKFSIGGALNDELILTDGTLNFEAKSSYAVMVRVTDSGGFTYDESMFVGVNDLDEAPTAITPTNFSINEFEDASSGWVLGSLGASDEDALETFSYAIQGGTDQAKFSIGGVGGNQLILTEAALNFAAKSSYEVVVRVTDSAGLTFDETMVVNVVANAGSTPTNEAPVPTNENPEPEIIVEGSDDEPVVPANVSDLTPPTTTGTHGSHPKQMNSLTVDDEQDSEPDFIAVVSHKFMFVDMHRADLPKIVAKVSSLEIPAHYVTNDLIRALDDLQVEIEQDDLMNQITIGTTLTASMSITFGYVIWMIRGGVLISSVLSSPPAWQMIDPLPVLSHFSESADDEDDESLEALVRKSNSSHEEVAVV